MLKKLKPMCFLVAILCNLFIIYKNCMCEEIYFKVETKLLKVVNC